MARLASHLGIFRFALLFTWLLPWCTRAETLVLKNGMELTGSLVKVSSLTDDVIAAAGGAGKGTRTIIMVDDGLRRVFVSSYQDVNLLESPPPGDRIKIDQPVARRGATIATVGPAVRITPFDDHGRRVFSMNTIKGQVDVVQGITEVGPLWTRVEGLSVSPAYLWDMRLATSAIPRETLTRILLNKTDRQDPTMRLNIVRLFLQARRYEDAIRELKLAIKTFPELADRKQQLVQLQQLQAREYLDEIKRRQAAGQYELAELLINNFPEDDIAGDLLVQVSELQESIRTNQEKLGAAKAALDVDLKTLDDGPARQQMSAILEELWQSVTASTANRLDDYHRLKTDETFGPEERLALAASGWLLGSGNATQNMSTAVSLLEVRELVREYLICDVPPRRQEILRQLSSLDGGSPKYVVDLLSAMTPPIATPELVNDKPDEDVAAGADTFGKKDELETDEVPSDRPAEVSTLRDITIEVPGLDDQIYRYVVQLPPEYDPRRFYPTVVTLHGAGMTPQLQVDWWAGPLDDQEGTRKGQAGRHGYIVIAPQWTSPRQRKYRYTAQEHARVLYALRDATKRFGIDTDKVFLTGHWMGGDAAWDIGLAHPDLWAGVILVGAVAEYEDPKAAKYVSRAWENARHVPLYYVRGDRDAKRIQLTGRDLDRYLTRAGFDAMVIEYRGRGHEHFQEEILNIFQWMALHRRDFYPRDWKVVAQRPWDNFFWWAELDEYPPQSMVLPGQWGRGRVGKATAVEGLLNEKNSLKIKTGAKKVTVYVSPRMVDFDDRFTWQINSRKQTVQLEPSLDVILEDVRTRGDRLHPFWVRLSN